MTAKEQIYKALGDKAIGDIVKIKENGVAKKYIIVQKGKPSSLYDDSCDGVWLLREKSHSRRAWHGANYETSVNDYENSEINAWLNGEFLNSIDEKIRAAIKTVKIPYKKGTGSGGAVQSSANGLSCKIFLLGGYEVGFTTNDCEYVPVDGTRLAYFLNGEEDSTAIQRRVCEDSEERAVYWWLRSADTDDTDYAWRVGADGALGGSYTCYSYAVRPALILPSSLLLNEDGTIYDSASDVQSDTSEAQQLGKLKEELFAATEKHVKNFLDLDANCGMYDVLTQTAHARFASVYSIIEKCGLVDEFEAWKRAHGIDR